MESNFSLSYVLSRTFRSRLFVLLFALAFSLNALNAKKIDLAQVSIEDYLAPVLRAHSIKLPNLLQATEKGTEGWFDPTHYYHDVKKSARPIVVAIVLPVPKLPEINPETQVANVLISSHAFSKEESNKNFEEQKKSISANSGLLEPDSKNTTLENGSKIEGSAGSEIIHTSAQESSKNPYSSSYNYKEASSPVTSTEYSKSSEGPPSYNSSPPAKTYDAVIEEINWDSLQNS